jgi:hypothetical protein
MKVINREEFFTTKGIERKQKEKSQARKSLEFIDAGQAVMFEKKEIKSIQSIRAVCSVIKKLTGKTFKIKVTKKGQVLVLRTV